MSELSKYAASCVRVHGMRDCLLSREDWQRFLQTGSAAGIISQLYHKNLVSSLSPLLFILDSLHSKTSNTGPL